jgi:hypothetical protein
MFFSQFRTRFSFFVMLTLLAFSTVLSLHAQSFTLPAVGAESNRNTTPLFPSALFTSHLESLKAKEAARPYWVFTESELLNYQRQYLDAESILLNNDILSFYGHPLSKSMGILGRHTKEELNTMLTQVAEDYRAVGGREVRKAFHLIYGTVWPAGEIGILGESVLREYIEYALENNILVFIDHQIGRYNPVDSLRVMLPWLRYPNVHLALDPEWRTTRPMQEIGTVSAAEINQAQRVMEEYMIENNISGERLLVIHQFNWVMISNREQVVANSQRVRLVHCADGFGSPSIKRQSYAYNAQAANIPIKGFKLFYRNMAMPAAGYDNPLMSPTDVYGLNPRPYLIMYQ